MKSRMLSASSLLFVIAGCTQRESAATAIADTSSSAGVSAPAAMTSAVAATSSSAGAPSGPTANACKAVGKLSSERHNMAIVASPDGRVFFIGGGQTDMAGPRAEVDVYDPKTGSVTPFATMKHGRILPGAVALADGRVVVIAGVEDGQTTIEVYEPSTNAFRVLPQHPKVGSISPFAIPMKDGRVLIGGGMEMAQRAEYPLKAFFLDPTTGNLTPTHDAPWALEAKHYFYYSIAPSGVVTVTGGGPSGDLGMPGRDCEATFDPATGIWTDRKNCKNQPDAIRYPATDGTGGILGWAGAMEVYRNGMWETVNKAPRKTTGASLDDGLALDAHHAMATDDETYEVVRCTF